MVSILEPDIQAEDFSNITSDQEEVSTVAVRQIEKNGCFNTFRTGVVAFLVISSILKYALPEGNLFQSISKNMSTMLTYPDQWWTLTRLELGRFYSSHIANMPLTSELLSQMLYGTKASVDVTDLFVPAMAKALRVHFGLSTEIPDTVVIANYFYNNFVRIGEKNLDYEVRGNIVLFKVQAASLFDADVSNSLNLFGVSLEIDKNRIELMDDIMGFVTTVRLSGYDRYDWNSSVLDMNTLDVRRNLGEVWTSITGEDLSNTTHPLYFFNDIVISLQDKEVDKLVDKGIAKEFNVIFGPIEIKDFSFRFGNYEDYERFKVMLEEASQR